jgi:DNA-binding SARP family transcriptional activator/tetratricopeptide (TPR) repeat protein
MEFRLLGPVEVWTDDRQLPIGGSLQRRLLAALLLHANRVVATERLIELLWGPQPPKTARADLQGRISNLRRVLASAGDRLSFRPPGYALSVAPAELDLHEFMRLADEGRHRLAVGDVEEASLALAAALALWRGPPLDGVEGLGAEAARLEERRLAALEDRIETDLRLGRHGTLVAELTALVAEQPIRERLRGHLMLALYRSGRQAEALAAFRELRGRLVEELGVEPSPPLQRLHERILATGPELDAPAVVSPSGVAQPLSNGSRAPPTTGPAPVPSQLPPGVWELTGRTEEIASLRAPLLAAGAADGPVVCAVSGKAGSGKTTLAVRVGHELIPSFPDGQLYVNLHGMDAGSVLPAREALAGFLRAFGVVDARLPDTVAERSALYRSLLAGRRVLVVLDDAASERQVRPLLPSQPGCGAIVTSRAPLSGLETARQLRLDVLQPDDAVQLLGRVAGHDRVAAEPEAADEIVRLCGCLPLGVLIAGARLAARRGWPLRVLAARLGDERRRLDELVSGDLEVRASIELSYRALDERERRGVRLLGLLGLPDFAPWLLAPVLDGSVAEGERMIDRLADAQLLDFAGVDATGQVRYRLHDLVRLFARERAEAEDAAGERTEAVRQVLGQLLALVDTASAREPTGIISLRTTLAGAGRVDRQLAEVLLRSSQAWFNAERATLVAAVERAGDLGLDDLACDLAAACVSSWFRVHNHFEVWERTHRAVLDATRRTGNLRGQAMMLAGLGQLYHELDRFGEGDEYLQQALDLFRQLGDRRAEAAALAGLGMAHREQGHYAEALRLLKEALGIYRALSDDAGIASVAYETGVVHRETGRLGEAMAALREALAAYRAIGSRRGEALMLRSIGLVYRATGELAHAEQLCSQALEMFVDIGDRLSEAYGVQALAKVHIRQGRGREDLEALTTCLAAFRELRDRFGEALALRTLGELYLAEGALDLAVRYLDQALLLWDELKLPVFRARTLRDLAALQRKRGDLTAADATLREALEIFGLHGSREYAELTSRDSVHGVERAGSVGQP